MWLTVCKNVAGKEPYFDSIKVVNLAGFAIVLVLDLFADAE
ncbi:hypothetical protein HMPREF0201_04575 [Cedecea davisae DSM 4568]|uniref:Uncharacterized protein n=1 Tax=Cedecea davisae DSM 4568 TaxID=566551 RepID=S3IZ80_9ENTR|nr:hypothetical protein HMPREF0201_04575 [Cedecea davisae DSM 4568]